MDTSPRRSLSLDLERRVGASSYPPTYGNCRGSPYTMQGLKSSPESKTLKSYMTNSPSTEPSPESVKAPRRENFFSNIFGALTSMVVEQLGKVPSSFMSNINNTLSVTVVPNEGIISQEFFKNLTRSCEQLATERTSDTMENRKAIDDYPDKRIYDIDPSISHIFTDKNAQFQIPSKTSTNFRTTNDSEIMEYFKEKSLSDGPVVGSKKIEEPCPRIVSPDTTDEGKMIFTEILSTTDDVKCDKTSGSFANPVRSDSIEAMTKSELFSRAASAETEIRENAEGDEIPNENCTPGWQTMWRKVVDGMSERFVKPRTASPDSDVPTKKANLSKTPRRKTCTVACGRGKGRGKSQLRRSGVSQSRHRKERTKQNIYSEIQDDLNALEDSETHENEDDDSLINERKNNPQSSFESRDWTDAASHRCPTLLDSFSFEISSSARKRKKGTRVRYVPESSPMDLENGDTMNYNIEKDCSSRLGELRPRLVSESSVDSEDSYCIVFENSSESEYDDYDFDEKSDDVSDDEADDDEKGTQTVRFNLEPEVHKMIKWDYAYRAARRGPWEEMARDRERFRGRIHCIERILNPILSAQHRNHIWQKRFDVDAGPSRQELVLF